MRTSTLERRQMARGVSAVELMVGVSILAAIVLFSTQAIMQFVMVGSDQVLRTQALNLTEEALEAIRFVRDDDWATFAAHPKASDLYVAFTTGPDAIAITATPQSVGAFTTTFQLFPVRRNDATHDIVATGGSVDTDTLLVSATTTWAGGSVTLSQYLANQTP